MKDKCTPNRKSFAQGSPQQPRLTELLQAQAYSTYVCRLVLPADPKQRPALQKQKAGADAAEQPTDDRRALLQTTTSSSTLNPTLECDGCPDTDTRERVNDTTQYPWTAVGMVTRDQQGAISRSVYSPLQRPVFTALMTLGVSSAVCKGLVSSSFVTDRCCSWLQ